MPQFFKQNLLSKAKEELLDNPFFSREPSQAEIEEDEDSTDLTNPVRTLLSWTAPSRPYRQKNRSFYVTVSLLVVLISLIMLLLFQDFMFVAALFSLMFLVYVLNFRVPEEVEYKISTQGVTIGDHFYHWETLDSFWFSEKEGFKMLNIMTNLRFPRVLIMMMGDKNESEIRKVAAKYLPFQEIAPKGVLDRWSDSLQKNFPLEKEQK